MTHECPGPGCTKQVGPSWLMCPGCWFQVPKPVRRAMHIAWSGGVGVGTSAHRAAIRLAVAAVRREVIPASSLKHRPAALPWKASRRPGSSPTSDQEGTDEHVQ